MSRNKRGGRIRPLILCMTLVLALAMCMPVSAATRSMSVSVKAVSKTSLKVSWKKSTKVKTWKIYKVKYNDEYEVSATKIKTVKGKYGSATIKNLKSGKYYSIRVIGFTKSGKKYCKGEAVGYTGLRTPSWSARQDEARYGPDMIELLVDGRRRGGLSVSAFQIYRKADTDSSYKKIKTLDPSVRKWEDKTVTAGKTYAYKMRAYTTYKGKRLYSSWSSVQKISAFNQHPSYKVEIITTPGVVDGMIEGITIKVQGALNNGPLEIPYYGMQVKFTDDPDTYYIGTAATLINAGSDAHFDGAADQAEGAEAVITGEQAVYLKYRFEKPVKNTYGTMYLESESVKYNGRYAYASFAMDGDGYAYEPSEG